jgi:DNA/RNA-binding domain of Phe-tRNA-synthetase-like protein
MEIAIDPPVRAASPELTLGVVSARVRVRPEDTGLHEELARACERVREELTGTDLAELPQIQALRRLYRRLGKDPTRYRGSAEALLRRIVHGKGLYPINTAVDVCNLVSVETRHAIGAYDLDKVRGPVSFRPATVGEVYEAIGRGALNLEGLPVFCDSLGPFGSPTSDSERTMITVESRHIAFVIVASTGAERLPEQVARTAAQLGRYDEAADVRTAIVT